MPADEIDVSCIGYSQTLFSILKPDRLCRGREHWIYQPDGIEEEMVFRTIISGTTIKDPEVRFLERGLRCSGKSMVDILSILFDEKRIVGWMEDGDPQKTPSDASGVELYQVNRPHAPCNKWGARYELPVEPATWERAMELGVDVFLIEPQQRTKDELQRNLRSYPPLVDEEVIPATLPEKVREALYLLVGHRNPQHPIARFQARAIPDILSYCSAVVLMHHDKHDVCLGIYTEAQEFEIPIARLREGLDVVVVPFSIPPMLARWDRALKELQKVEPVEALNVLFAAQEDSISESTED